MPCNINLTVTVSMFTVLDRIVNILFAKLNNYLLCSTEYYMYASTHYSDSADVFVLAM